MTHWGTAGGCDKNSEIIVVAIDAEYHKPDSVRTGRNDSDGILLKLRIGSSTERRGKKFFRLGGSLYAVYYECRNEVRVRQNGVVLVIYGMPRINLITKVVQIDVYAILNR
jgi:hypothetical protein